MAAALLVFPIVVSATFIGGSLKYFLEGTSALEKGQKLLVSDPVAAQKSFTSAGESLNKALLILQKAPLYTKLLTPLPPIRWQVQLAKSGQSLAAAGAQASALSQSFPVLSQDAEISAWLGKSSAQIHDWYKTRDLELDQLQDNLNLANLQLQKVPSWLTRDGSLKKLKQQLELATTQLPKIRQLADITFQNLGSQDAQPHQYLILFQNNQEIRPTGGFFGSYATLTASGGTIRQFQFGQDIYKLDKPFSQKTKYRPPEPLRTITPYWAFRDSSVGEGFLDPASQQVARFYQEETNTNLDGIIYLDLTILMDLLDVTGPVTLTDPDLVLTADSVDTTLTQYIEKDYFETAENQSTQEPKSVLADAIPVILQAVQTQPNALNKLLPKLQRSVQRKSIQIWGKDEEFQASLANFFPTDTPPSGPWLKLVNNNLGGLKSSGSVEQKLQIERQHAFLDTVDKYTLTLTRSHLGSGAWPDGENKNYSEIYLPADAIVINMPTGKGGESALSETIQALAGPAKTSWTTSVETGDHWQRVGFWSTVSVGESASFTLVFTLPHSQLPLTILKQAGSMKEQVVTKEQIFNLESNLVLPIKLLQ